MYIVTITIQNKNKQEDSRIFMLDDISSTEYHSTMNEISDYLYDLDIDYEVDMDGDMLIDDILMSLSEQEPFEQIIREKKRTYIIKGQME